MAERSRRKDEREKDWSTDSVVCDVGEWVSERGRRVGAAADAQELTVIHTCFCHRCSLLLLFLCSLICITSCRVTLEHWLWLLQQRKQTYFWWHLWNLTSDLDFGPNWWDPRRLMAVRASCMRASGCTRLLPLGPSSCSNPFPFSLLPYHCGDKTGHGSKLHLTLQNRACPKWLHFTSCRWLSPKCNADNGGHETSLYTQTHFSPGPSMTQRVKITIISKVRISLVHLSK